MYVRQETIARNASLIADWTSGMSLPDVQQKYGLAVATVGKIVKSGNATRPSAYARKLNPAQLDEIRSAPMKPGAVGNLAAKFQVSHTLISLIRSGKRHRVYQPLV